MPPSRSRRTPPAICCRYPSVLSGTLQRWAGDDSLSPATFAAATNFGRRFLQLSSAIFVANEPGGLFRSLVRIDRSFNNLQPPFRSFAVEFLFFKCVENIQSFHDPAERGILTVQ